MITLLPIQISHDYKIIKYYHLLECAAALCTAATTNRPASHVLPHSHCTHDFFPPAISYFLKFAEVFSNFLSRGCTHHPGTYSSQSRVISSATIMYECVVCLHCLVVRLVLTHFLFLR